LLLVHAAAMMRSLIEVLVAAAVVLLVRLLLATHGVELLLRRVEAHTLWVKGRRIACAHLLHETIVLMHRWVVSRCWWHLLILLLVVEGLVELLWPLLLLMVIQVSHAHLLLVLAAHLLHGVPGHTLVVPLIMVVLWRWLELVLLVLSKLLLRLIKRLTAIADAWVKRAGADVERAGTGR